jgi:response regulator RpfG family c-di-GMP phosphodiesterase
VSKPSGAQQGARSEPKASEGHREREAERRSNGEPSGGAERRRVVLLVDDEPRILSALYRTLRREGYELLTAETTAEALRMIDESPIDCVLSDHKMPGMTGLELLEHVASRRPNAARLLITGWNLEIEASELARLGVQRVLSKPWDDRELKQALRAAMGGLDS